MNMRMVLMVILSAVLPQMVGAMDPVVRARGVLVGIRQLEADLQQDQEELQQLQGQQRQLQAELSDPRVIQLVANLQGAQQEMADAQQAAGDAEAMQAIAEGADKDRALIATQDVEFRIMQLTDQIKDFTSQMERAQIEAKQDRLEQIGASIADVLANIKRSQEDRLEEEDKLSGISAGDVAEARHILAGRARAEAFIAPPYPAPEPVVDPQVQAAEQARLAEQAAELRAAQEARARRQAAAQVQAGTAVQGILRREGSKKKDLKVTFEGPAEEEVAGRPPAVPRRPAERRSPSRRRVAVPAAPVAPPAPPVALPGRTISGKQKQAIVGIVTAIAVAVATYIGRRRYQNKKDRLVKKYALGSLTPLQNSIWRATALASVRMPWYLRYLVKNNFGSLTDFVGSNPRALAELYYGRKPSTQEVQSFLSRFFEGV